MKKILVIDDNDEVRENIVEILQLSNYKVISAGDGKAGVELAIKEMPDLIICDIMMPVLDGYGVLHMLGKHKELSGIPFIFLTAKYERTDLRKGMEMGADDYLIKPFEGIDLLQVVETRINKAEAFKNKFNQDADGIDRFFAQAEQYGNIRLTSEEREISEYGKKHILYSEGHRPKVVFFIISGKVKIYKINQEGKELITNICNAGDFFGYTAILEEKNYHENAGILEDAKLMLIPRDDFIELLSHDLNVARQFIKIISRNITEKEDYLLNIAYSSLRKRVAYGIIQLSGKLGDHHGKGGVLNISRENLAKSIGIATESLIRTLAEFKSENLIDLQPGMVIIRKEEELKNLLY